MRYCIDHEEASCFERNGYVLIKELFPHDKIQKLLTSFQVIFREQKDSIENQKREACFDQASLSFYARDVSINSLATRKILFSKAIGHIACQLANRKKLRYGGDWLWQGNRMPWSMNSEPSTFEASFCIKPLALGCLIALTDRSEELTQEELFLPKKAGDALFFSSNLSYPWASLAEQKNSQKFLLMIYAEADAAYTLTLSDPHTHNLKHMGYIFGERLKETTHPHIVR